MIHISGSIIINTFKLAIFLVTVSRVPNSCSKCFGLRHYLGYSKNWIFLNSSEKKKKSKKSLKLPDIIPLKKK